MRGLVLRLPASTRSAQAGATVRSKENRGLLGGVGQAIGDLADGAHDAVETALKDVGDIADELTGAPSAAPHGIPSGGGTGSSATGGWISTRPETSHPTYTPPASGGDEPPDPPPPAATRATSASALSAPTQMPSGPTDGTATPMPPTATRPSRVAQKWIHTAVPSSAEYDRTGVLRNTASATHSTSPTAALAGGAGRHGRGFPPGAAAAIGCVLGLLVLCAAIWFYRSRLRRRAARAYPHPKRTMSLISATTVSTVPLFITAREPGVADENPFRHPRDADEDDPFAARASWWSASTRRSASTISI